MDKEGFDLARMVLGHCKRIDLSWRQPENENSTTYRNQSTAMMRLMSSVGSPTDVSTMIIVTNPA